MNSLINQFRDLWSPLGVNQKISLILASGLVALAMIAMMIWAAQPDMQLLYGNLSSEEAGKIAAKLDQKSIKFETGKGGNSIYVEASKVHELRWQLAADGLVPTGTGPGLELFDKGSFGISDFAQRVNYNRAIQGELARTIGQFDGVNSARVMVVMPENRIVVGRDARDRPTASVMVETSGTLMVSAVNSIRHLVANAVQGLEVNDVVVVDAAGKVLTEELKDDGIGGGLSNTVIRYRQGMETYFTTRVQSMLDRVLGPNQSEVRVGVVIDTSSNTVTETKFDDEGVIRSSTTRDNKIGEIETETSTTGAGLAANLPGGQTTQTAGPGREKTTSDKTVTQQYEIGGSERTTVQTPGSIVRTTASVLVARRYKMDGQNSVANPRTAEEIESLRQIVVNSLGITLAPGKNADSVVTVTEMDFAPNALSNHQELMESDLQFDRYIDIGKNLVGAVLGVGLVFFFLQMLKRNQPEKISLEVLQPEQMLQSRRLEDTSVVTPEMLNELIRQKPSNIGITLKGWIGETEGAKK